MKPTLLRESVARLWSIRTRWQAQQIWHVPWNVEGHDLPPAVAHDLEPLRKPLQQQAALRRTVAFADDVLVRPDLADVHWHVEQGLLLVVRERGDVFQPANERQQLGRNVRGHARSPSEQAGARE